MKKKRGRPKNKNAVAAAAAAVASEEDEAEVGESKKGKGSPMAKEPPTAAPTPAATAWRQPPSSSSFQQYRRAGDMGELPSSDFPESAMW